MLHGANRLVSDEGLEAIRDLPLISLTMLFTFEQNLVTDVGLEYLQGMPLTALELKKCCECVTINGIKTLGGLPGLTHLDLAGADISNSSLKHLKGMQLKSLRLAGCQRLTDGGLKRLWKFPLTNLDLTATNISSLGLMHLKSFHTLNSLNLSLCANLSNDGLENLGGMPINCLNLERNHWLSDDGIAKLGGLPLTQLNREGCPKISAECQIGSAGLQAAWNFAHDHL